MTHLIRKRTLVGVGGVALTLVLAVPLIIGQLVVGQQATKPSSDKEKKQPEFPPLDTVIKGMEVTTARQGEKLYYTLYYDLKKGRMLGEIPSSQLNKPFLMYITIAGGAYAGWPGDDLYVTWERRDKQLVLVQPEVRYKAKGGEIADVVRKTYTDRILTTTPILTMGRSGPVIDLGGLLGDKAGLFVGPLAAGTSPSLMKFPAPKAFPGNVEIDITLPRVGNSGGFFSMFGSGTSGALTVHYSISALPSTGYKPRQADDRIGYFLTAVKDFSKDPRDDTRFVRYVNRWHVEKEDPKADVSLAKDPVVFYVEKTVPRKFRRWVHEGILEWNKAFEKIGILNAIVVRQQTETNEFKDLDPADRRYNFFRWIASDVPFAMGPSRVHPETGEILDADIIFDDSFIRYYLHQYDMLIRDGRDADLSPRLQQFLEQNPQRHPMRRWLAHDRQPTSSSIAEPIEAVRRTFAGESAAHLCRIGVGMRHELTFGLTAYHVLYAKDADSADKDEKKKEEKKDESKDDEKADKKEPETKPADTDKDDDEKKEHDDDDDGEADDQDEKKSKSRKKSDEWPTEFIGAVLREVVMHEVGHTLGLRHNFKASSWLTLEEINKRKEKGEPTVGSVMDYNPTNVRPTGEDQGAWITSTLGPYDYWAIEYGYTSKDGESDLNKIASRVAEAGLAYATDEDVWNSDPLVNRFDLGAEPLNHAKQRVRLVGQILDKLLDNFVEDGQGYQRVRQAFEMLMYDHMQAGVIAAKYIGGHYLNRDHKGDPDARPPVQVVEAAKQRAALAFLRDQVFSDTAFDFPPELINHLAAGRWRHWGTTDALAQVEYPIHDRILQIQLWAMFDVLNGMTLARLHDGEMRVDADADLVTIPELLGELSGAIWSEVAKPLPPDGKWSNRKPLISSIRRNLQREYVAQLIDIALEGPYGFSPQVARTQAWYELKKLRGQLSEKLRPEQARSLDDYSVAHLDETRTRIDKALEAIYSLSDSSGGYGGFPFFREAGREERPRMRPLREGVPRDPLTE